jgi:hypothetical protein
LPLRKADLSSTRQFKDGDAWLIIRTQLTKSESDAVADASSALRAGQSGAEVVQQTAIANRTLFAILAQDWSLGDECTGEAYATLDEESGLWVDECIGTVLEERRKRAEKNAPTSRRRRKPAGSPVKAAAST